MRSLLLLIFASTLAANALACSCFSPELRAKTGRETLELTRVAVFGQIVEVKADGVADMVVLESFKGSPTGAHMAIEPDAGKCPSHPVMQPGKVLVVAFQTVTTVCETYDQDHFLLEAFRSNAAK